MALNEELNQLLTAKIDKEEFSGAVLVKQDDGTLFEGAYGYANRSWKVKNQVDTRFRIASISKMFTAAAILQLVDAGQLSLDASVLECLGLRNTRIPMEATVYHMLTMTSGIADWFDETGDWEANWAALCREHPIYLFRRNQDYLPLFVSEEPLAPVGEKHQYNGAGYILLGLIVEKLSGVSYFDYVRHNVFAKADMSRSDFLALDGIDDAVAEGYIPITDEDKAVIGWRKNIYSTTPEAAADGGATSTAADLVRFSQALRNEGLLSPELTQEMLTPKVLQTDERTRGYTWKYGYANAFLLDDDGQIVRWGHTGEEDGVSCRLYHYPEENLDVVILGNQSWCAGSLGWEIHDIVLELDPQ
jgi:CubicO group peptidase (beta-lactamase class C family)